MLGGDLLHVVVREGVTPMEAAVLRTAHESEQAVEVIELTGKSNVTPAQEYRRLEKIYSVKFMEETFGPGAKNMPAMLPTSFEEVLVPQESDSEEDEEEVSAGGRKKSSRGPKTLVTA